MPDFRPPAWYGSHTLHDLLCHANGLLEWKPLAVAFEGKCRRPACASGGIKLVQRTPSKGGSEFWGCSQYPRGRASWPMTAAFASNYSYFDSYS